MDKKEPEDFLAEPESKEQEPISEQDLAELAAECGAIERKLKAEMELLPPREVPLFETLAHHAIAKVVQLSQWIGEYRLRLMADSGERFFNEQYRKMGIIEALPKNHTDWDALVKECDEKERRIRKEIGSLNEIKYLNVIGDMFTFCNCWSNYGERQAMEWGLPINRVYFIAAYFYRPVFYWQLFKARFLG